MSLTHSGVIQIGIRDHTPEESWFGNMRVPEKSDNAGKPSKSVESQFSSIEVSSRIKAEFLRLVKGYRIVSKSRRPYAGVLGGIRYRTIFWLSAPEQQD